MACGRATGASKTPVASPAAEPAAVTHHVVTLLVLFPESSSTSMEKPACRCPWSVTLTVREE